MSPVNFTRYIPCELLVNEVHCTLFLYIGTLLNWGSPPPPLKEREAEKCQTFKNMLRTWLRKGEELLFWILHKIMKIVCQLMFVNAKDVNEPLVSVTSPIVLCMYNFVLNLILLLSRCFLASQGGG